MIRFDVLGVLVVLLHQKRVLFRHKVDHEDLFKHFLHKFLKTTPGHCL